LIAITAVKTPKKFWIKSGIFFWILLILLPPVGALEQDSFFLDLSTQPKVSRQIPVYEKNAVESPDWIKDAVIYKVNLRAFSQTGKIYELESRLGALRNMGISVIELMPLHPIGEIGRVGIHGSPLSVEDYDHISIEYGTRDALKTLVREAHFYGLRVIVNWVAVGTSWDNELFEDHPNWYYQGKSGMPTENFKGKDTVQFNYASKDLRKYMKRMMVSWVRTYDVDGFSCVNSDFVPLDFWEELKEELLIFKSDIVLLSQGTDPRNHLKAFNLTTSHLIYNVFKDIFEGKSGIVELKEALELEDSSYPKGALQVRYIEDFNQLRSSQQFGPALNAMAVLLLTLGEVPMIYNGQEIAENRMPSLFKKDVIDWKNKTKHSSKSKKFYKKLLIYRSRHPSLVRGQRFEIETSDPDSVFAFTKVYREDAVLVVVNLTQTAFKGTINLPESFVSPGGKINLKPLFKKGHFVGDGFPPTQLNLPPWGYEVWEVK